MKIGIIGFGAIGFDVAKKLDKETNKFNVIGVHSRTKNKIIDKTSSFNSPLRYFSLDEICKKSDVIIDCAPKEAFKEIIQKCLYYKTKLITVSCAGILENQEIITSDKSFYLYLGSFESAENADKKLLAVKKIDDLNLVTNFSIKKNMNNNTINNYSVISNNYFFYEKALDHCEVLLKHNLDCKIISDL